MATFAEDIQDLFDMVVEDYVHFKGQFADLASLFPDYWIACKAFEKMKVKGGSHTVSFNLKIKNVGTYRSNVDLFDEDQPSRDDMFIKGSVTYTGLNIGTFFDVQEEDFSSPDSLRRVNYLKELVEAALQRFMLNFSADMWAYPAASTTKGVLGFPYWVAKSTATAEEAFGFNGQAVYGDDVVGNVSQSTYAQWKNGTGVYATLASEAGLDMLNLAMNKCNFRTKSSMIGSPDSRSLPTYGLYTTYDNFEDLERYTRNQNDNLGSDVGAYRGSVTFRSTPVMYLWEFTEDEIEEGYTNVAKAKNTNNPVYGINWETFDFLTQRSTGLEKNGPRDAPNQRFVKRVDWDQRGQFVCTNRRKNFVLHQAS